MQLNAILDNVVTRIMRVNDKPLIVSSSTSPDIVSHIMRVNDEPFVTFSQPHLGHKANRPACLKMLQ